MGLRLRTVAGLRVAVGLTVAASLVGCSSPGPVPPPDADAQVPCELRQRAYVDTLIAPDQQIDVAATVRAVLGASEVDRTMPYCSGERPVSEAAANPPIQKQVSP
ncbi:MAG: hypothetical protein H7138_13440 [Myxococcales bacterium]|nr:hypothetical protein [Myxococcales bacterium]